MTTAKEAKAAAVEELRLSNDPTMPELLALLVRELRIARTRVTELEDYARRLEGDDPRMYVLT